MGSSRINAVRQRLGLVDRKSISGPVRKDIDKFKSKQKFDSTVRDKEQQEFYGDVLEKGGPRLDVEGIDPAMDELRAGDPMAVQLDFESMPYGSKQNKKGVISWETSKKTIPASRVEGTSPKPKYILTQDKGGLIEIPTEDSELSEKLRAEGPPETSVPAFNIDAFGATITKPNAEKWAKSARIQMARERLGAVGKISNLNDKMISKARYKGKDFPHKTNSSAFLTPDGTFVGTNDHARTVINTDYKYNKFLTEKGGSLSRVTTQWLRDSGAYRLRGIYPDYNKRESLSGLHIQGYVEPTKQQIKQLTKLRDQVGSENVTWEGSDFTEKLGLDIKKPQERTHTEMMGAKLRQRIAGLGFRERILNWLKEQPRFKSFDPDSSFVGTVKYDQDNQSMQIELNGKKYDFCNVEERLFDSFSGAGSKGAFFNREIKSLHNCGAW